MPTPSYAALAGELALAEYSGLTDAQARDHAAVKYPPPPVRKRFSAVDLIAACSTPYRGNLAPVLNGNGGQLVIAQDAERLAAGVDALAALGAISSADAAAMKAVLNQTEPDPNPAGVVALPG